MPELQKEQIVVPPTPLSLFYSYAHEDEALRDQLEKHLRQLQRQGLISSWHDRKILPGNVWSHEIDTHLQTASLILLLISPDFLASDYCYDNEMHRALERHRNGEAHVVPIILRPCDWEHSPLKDLQCLPRDGKAVTRWSDQDEIFNTITRSLRSIIEQQQALANPLSSLSPLNQQNRTRLLKRVRTIWIDGLLTQSLHRAAAIELHLQDRPDMLANPWQLQVQELHQAPLTLPQGTTIAQVYDRADSELLILGEPGAGKTTLLLELTRTLLTRAEQDERLRIPVVFNLSSWAEQRQLLHTWLVEELATKYLVPRNIAQGWITANQILPLLDGLDEVAKEARSACVEQINRYYQALLERGSSSLVVCCRSAEYTFLTTHIALQHAVNILPLTDEQINSYLEQGDDQVQGLQQALNEDIELHSLARQPLMLTIFIFAYQGATIAEIPNGTSREDIQYAIFARYVEHMLKRRGQSQRWQSEQVMNWLTFLAKQMQQHNQTVFSIENLQPMWLSKRCRTIYQWCLGLIFGLIGVLIGLITWLVGGLFVGLGAGLFFGLFFGFAFELAIKINPIETLSWSWKEAKLGAAVGLVCWFVLGLLANLSVGPLAALATSGCIITGLVVGLLGKEFPERLSLSPNESIHRSGKNGLFVGLPFGLFVGVVLGLVLGLPFGLFIGAFSGALLGLIFGLDTLIKHFILRIFLSRHGDLPWDIVAFLDEATERLLLRKVGGSYIFVHRLLLDYFADLGEK